MAESENGSIGSNFWQNDEATTEVGEHPKGYWLGVKRTPEGRYKIVSTHNDSGKIVEGEFTSYDKAEKECRLHLAMAWDNNKG